MSLKEREGVVSLGGSELSATSLWHAAMLARSTGETVWIGELVGGNVHIVHQTVRPDDLVQALGGSGILPWHTCALGYAIAAGLDDAALADLLAFPARRLTGLTVVDPESLHDVLAVTRQRGYAVEAHAATLGDAGIAAAVVDSAGRVVGAVGIVGPAERILAEPQLAMYVASVCAAAEALSETRAVPQPRPTYRPPGSEARASPS
jgi:DNA-binding IclR family transcriptional regulator